MNSRLTSKLPWRKGNSKSSCNAPAYVGRWEHKEKYQAWSGRITAVLVLQILSVRCNRGPLVALRPDEASRSKNQNPGWSASFAFTCRFYLSSLNMSYPKRPGPQWWTIGLPRTPNLQFEDKMEHVWCVVINKASLRGQGDSLWGGRHCGCCNECAIIWNDSEIFQQGPKVRRGCEMDACF